MKTILWCFRNEKWEVVPAGMYKSYSFEAAQYTKPILHINWNPGPIPYRVRLTYAEILLFEGLGAGTYV